MANRRQLMFGASGLLLTTSRSFAERQGSGAVAEVGSSPVLDHAVLRIAGAEAMIGAPDHLDHNHVMTANRNLNRDARTAWKFFKIWSRSFSSVTPGTAYIKDGKLDGYHGATMWDIGSALNAHVAACLLGLKSNAELLRTAKAFVGLLKQVSLPTMAGKLPCLEIVLGHRNEFKPGFDSADAGRLLLSLKILDNMTGGTAGITKLVASWQFGNVIRDGKVLSIRDGKFQDVPTNSYTHYASQGFRLWGFAVDSPYPADTELESQERKAAFLRQVAAMGRVATEPNTTELIELGESAAANLICDILLAAQIRRFEATGQLTCVSEGIIDQVPWFTYQSCQWHFDGLDEWPIESTDDAKGAIIKARGEALRTISTKACFHWWAVRPGIYSLKLIEAARKLAATPRIGFASNIYAQDLRPTYCSDVNVNALILEAAAYALNGKTPLLKLSEHHLRNR